MTLKQLQYLVTLVDSGSFSQAARALHISQPPLSMQIRDLEEELGVRLFDRSTRVIRPTDACLRLYDRARAILDITEEITADIRADEEAPEGRLILGTITSCGNVILGPTLQDFAGRYPGIRFELIEGNTYLLLEKLKKHELDLAFVRTPFDTDGLVCCRLISEPMSVTAPASLLPPGPAMTIEELTSYPLIIYKRFEPLLSSVFHRKGLEMNVRCLNEDARTTLMWAASGIGCGITPRSITSLIARPGLTIREIAEPALMTDVNLVYRKGQYLSPAARRLIDAYQTGESLRLSETFPPPSRRSIS